MQAHQVAAGLFVGGIEIDDSSRNLVFCAGGDILRLQTGAKASHQPVMDRLAFGQNPDPKRRIEIVHAFEDPLAKVRGVEQQGMDTPAFGRLDDAFDIDLHPLGIKMDGEPFCDKPAVSRVLKGGAQFANYLT